MKKISGMIIAIILIMGFCGVANARDYSAAVERQLQNYPQSTLRDIYKSFFQDHFGPGHLVEDTISARNYLHSELTEMGDSSLPYYEEVGAGDNFYRANLSLITEGIISEDLFFEAFIESAASFTLPSVAEWAEEWNEILAYIPNDLPGYDEDKAQIAANLAAGKYAMHHSEVFEKAYRPHYRLISKSIFCEKLLPLIVNQQK